MKKTKVPVLIKHSIQRTG